jgi:hypothetical protein
VGSVAYKLKLSAHSTIHLVVHVSQLRLAEGFKGQVSSQLPSDMVKYQVPLQILNTKLVTRGDNQVSQVLIKWSELPNDLATWEDHEVLKQSFSTAPA